MTNEEAKVFLDNLKICIDEHPIVADWLVEIADRKTESNSEKPNNCEDCRHYNPDHEAIACERCLDGKYSRYEPKDEPTISKMEQVDKDINVRSKGEPQNIGYCNECKWYGDKQVCGRCRIRNLYAPKAEPQTERSE